MTYHYLILKDEGHIEIVRKIRISSEQDIIDIEKEHKIKIRDFKLLKIDHEIIIHLIEILKALFKFIFSPQGAMFIVCVSIAASFIYTAEYTNRKVSEVNIKIEKAERELENLISSYAAKVKDYKCSLEEDPQYLEMKKLEKKK